MEVTEAHPGHRRPYATFNSTFFSSKKLALQYKQKLMEEKLEEFEEGFETDEFKPEEKHLTDGTYSDLMYNSRGYMEMPAYDIKVYKIEIQDTANID